MADGDDVPRLGPAAVEEDHIAAQHCLWTGTTCGLPSSQEKKMWSNSSLSLVMWRPFADGRMELL